MRASSVSRPIFSASMTSAPDWLIVPPITRSPTVLVTGINSPVTIDSSSAERPSATLPSTGTFSPGRMRRRSPTDDPVERHFLLAAAGQDSPRRLGREVEQGADRAGGLRPRPQLQHLAEQDENRDDRGGFEIDRNRTFLPAQDRREQSGRSRPDDAVDPGHAGAERDQREHVEAGA